MRIVLALVNGVTGIIQLLLGVRLLLKFFGVNAQAPFVRWVYDTSQPLLTMFQGIFPAPVIDGRYVIELSTLVAMVVYGFIAYMISTLVRLPSRFHHS